MGLLGPYSQLEEALQKNETFNEKEEVIDDITLIKYMARSYALTAP